LFGPPIIVASGGQFLWETGTLQGNVQTTRLEVKVGGLVNIVSPTDKVLTRLIRNFGTVFLQSGRQLWVQGGSIVNKGVFQIGEFSTVSAVDTTETFLNDGGTIAVQTGGAVLNISVIGGILDVGSDLCQVSDNATFGVVKSSALGSLVLKSQLFTLSSGALSQFYGNFNWDEGDILITDGSILSLYGTATFSGSDLGTDGTGGTINNFGVVAINSANSRNSQMTCENQLNNYGNISIVGSFAITELVQVGGQIAGSGALNVLLGFFYWKGGNLIGTLPSGATPTFVSAPQVVISENNRKVLSLRTLSFSGPDPISVTHSGPFSMTKRASVVVGPSATFVSSSSITSSDNSGGFTNEGTLQGALQLTGITFSSSGTIGGDDSTSVNVVNGTVTLSLGSVISTVVSAPNQFTSLKTTGLLIFAGPSTLNIKLDKNLVVDSSSRIDIISYGAVKYESNLTINVDDTHWINPNACGGKKTTWLSSRNALELTFTGCKQAAPTPPPETQTQQLQTFYIVAAVVIAIAVAIGFIAWCQKKYKKRPWDRLR